MKKLLISLIVIMAPACCMAQTFSAYEQLSAGDAEAVSVPSPRTESRAGTIGIGISHSGDPFNIPDFSQAEIAELIAQVGGNFYRPHIPLNMVMPELSSADMLRLEQATADPAALEAMIAELAASDRWARIDSLVNTFSDRNINLILVVGAGYRKEAPLYTVKGKKEPVSPGKIGRDNYLTLMRWITGATVRRYADRVKYWQVENEINVAYMVHVTSNWRTHDMAWADHKFLDKLLRTLSSAVHEEGKKQGKELKTCQNFATDGVFTGWSDLAQIQGNSGDLDIVGIDLYPNYLYSHPIKGKDNAQKRMRQALAAAAGRPVWVLETGYPRAPQQRGYTEASQAEYFRDVFNTCYGEGAELVLAFGWFWNPAGWFTDSSKPLPWYHPMAVERYWSPLNRGEAGITFGRAWQEFKEAAVRWTDTAVN